VMFVAGEDPEAKATAADLLRSLGWRSIMDLGGLTAARGMEMYVVLWVSIMQAQQGHNFNIKVIRT
jgi:predicted dinucleotide-binding enzyme